MLDRSQCAVSLARRLAIRMAELGLIAGIAAAITERVGWLERLGYIILVPAASFATFFALVFVVAYAFPPPAGATDVALRFPRAGRVIWPLVALLTAAVLYFVLRPA
jgi:type IV secretory pathway VirB2 component (pilin)